MNALNDKWGYLFLAIASAGRRVPSLWVHTKMSQGHFTKVEKTLAKLALLRDFSKVFSTLGKFAVCGNLVAPIVLQVAIVLYL